MTAKLTIYQGDITQLKVNVVVNAANERLAGGGGVDGAIHRAAGSKQLQEACAKIGGCPTGEVRKTAGFNLPAQAIYHAVGPVWHGGDKREVELLASCYQQAMELLQKDQFQSIAFPAISCGVYGFPVDKAAAIAVKVVKKAAAQNQGLKEVVFCCFDEATADVYRRILADEE